MENKPFFKCGVVGLMVVAMSLFLLTILPTKADVGPMPEGFVTPIIAFEFAKTPLDVENLFAVGEARSQMRLAAAMDLGNILDYGYMVLYSLFLGWFSFICVKVSNNRFFYLPCGLAGLALIGDALENVQLLGITAKLATMDIGAELSALQIFTWIKWGSLAFAFLLLAFYFIQGGWFSSAIAVVGVACFCAGCVAFFQRSAANEIFGGLTGVMYLLMIVYCFLYRQSGPAPQ